MDLDTTKDKLFDQVLLIEDEDAHALIINRALRNLCSAVVRCRTHQEGLVHLKDHSPSLIVTDLNLPDKPTNGPVKSLRAAAPNSFVVVLTSSTSWKDGVDAMKQGAHDFIVKAFDENFGEALGLALTRVWTQLVAAREKERLQREMEVLRISIENSKDGLAIVDGLSTINYANRSFATFAERCGCANPVRLSDLFSAEVARADTLRSTILDKLSALSPGAVWTTEVSFTKNPAMAFELSLSPLPHRNDLTSRICAMWVRDISPQKQREKFQKDILSTTTHDLKGPLGAILLSADMLERILKENIKGKEIALRIGSSAQGAINLIDEFLSARRIQEGTFVLKPAKHNIGELLNGVIVDFETISNARSIKLQFEKPAMEVVAEVDKLGFVRVISNLLSNAMKFTKKDGQVKVRLTPAGEEFHVVVSDTGCGMEPNEAQQLFERFSRLEKHREVAGTGLGLFVVKAIVNAHGGKIDLTSKVNEGTTFDLTFPVKAPVNERGELYSLSFA